MNSVVFINSHPIQYFAPLYKEMAQTSTLDLEVVYCSDESIKGKEDKGFGEKVKWDIPLLEGYAYRFLPNRSFKPSIHNGFLGVFNPGIIGYLIKKQKSIIVVHGWHYATLIIAIIVGRIRGHRICIRGDNPLNQEVKKNKLITFLKHCYLRVLFLFINDFLYVGKENKALYKHLGVREKHLHFIPHAIDNKRFHEIFLSVSKQEARAKCGLPSSERIILFSAKYIQKKRPLDLLKAFKELPHNNVHLVMVGEGELRAAMESYIKEHNLQNLVTLTGFINQSQIPYYYAAADVFVMCSGMGETWGLSVNEAMNFGLPVVISDMCGCAADLVEDGINGFIYNTGNVEQLADRLNVFLEIDKDVYRQMSERSLARIKEYSYTAIIKGLEAMA